VLILELTRRLAGLALVVIAAIFIAYAFVGPWLPGLPRAPRLHRAGALLHLHLHRQRHPRATTAVSSTYIILFITFAAFLQASKVGDYFVNFAFAAAGRARGGPAKVAVFASGLMGMINGTSAGNVVATGSLTIPLMKKVGYKPQTAGAVEAAASSGGQIMPPIMGAGRLHHGRDHRHPLHRDRHRGDHPGAALLRVGLLHGRLRGAKLGMKGLPRDELPKFASWRAGLPVHPDRDPDRRALRAIR
jgi:hypothetical protein